MKEREKAKNKKKKGIQVNTVRNKLNGICVGRPCSSGSKCRAGLSRRWFMDKVFHSSCSSCFNKSRGRHDNHPRCEISRNNSAPCATLFAHVWASTMYYFFILLIVYLFSFARFPTLLSSLPLFSSNSIHKQSKKREETNEKEKRETSSIAMGSRVVFYILVFDPQSLLFLYCFRAHFKIVVVRNRE